MNVLRVWQVIIVAVLAFVLVWRTDFDGVRQAIGGAGVWQLAAVVGLNVPIVLLLGLRSQLVLGVMGRRLPAALVFPAAIVGNVAGSVTPVSSGELLRAALLRSHADLPVEAGLALVVFERSMSLYLLVITTGCAGAMLALPGPAAPVLAGAAVLFMAVPLAAGRAFGSQASGAPEAGGSFAVRASRLMRTVGALLHDPGLYVRWGACTLAVFALNGLQVWLVADSLHASASGLDAWTALGTSQLAGIASLLPFGLGASDGSLAAVLGKLGSTLQEGAAVAVLVRMTSTLPLIMIALGCYLYLMRRGRAVEASGGAQREAAG